MTPADRLILFDVRRSGSEEIIDAVGLIGRGVDFEKWRPLIRFGISEVASKVGAQIVEQLCGVYSDTERDPDPVETELITLLQQAVAMFTWLRVIPTLDAQHDEAGRGKRLGENEKGLTALQEYKDEENIRRMAYEATDALLRRLDAGDYPYWQTTDEYRRRGLLLIRSKAEFDRFYRLGYHLVFEMIMPIMEEVQYATVMSAVGRERFDRLVALRDDAKLLEAAQWPLALLTMGKAFRRLSAELLPGGVTQLQMTQPVASRLRAEKEAREGVASELEDSGRDALRRLEQFVAELDKDSDDLEIFNKKHISHSKGFSF